MAMLICGVVLLMFTAVGVVYCEKTFTETGCIIYIMAFIFVLVAIGLIIGGVSGPEAAAVYFQENF